MEIRSNKLLRRLRGKTVFAMGSEANILQLKGKYQLQIRAILDNDPGKSRTDGPVEICLPAKVLVPRRRDVVILIYSPGYWKEMRAQLRTLGYSDRQIIIMNETHAEDNTLRRFAEACRFVAEGRRVHRRLTADARSPFEIIFMRGATGDAYLNGRFLPEYMARDKSKTYVIAGNTKGLAKVMKMFDFEGVRVVPLSLREADTLIRYGFFAGLERTHIKNVFLWQGDMNFNRCRTRLTERFNFMDTYRYLIYHTEPEDSGTAPEPKPSLDVGELFRSYALTPEKTILFAPIAYSVKPLPAWFWKEAADRLRAKGYTICANLGPEERSGLEFLTPVMLPFDSLLDFLNRAGGFIGLRSGLCDIISSANCRKVILYPSDKPKYTDSLHRCDLAFSGLNRMGMCTDAIELESEAIDDILIRPGYSSGVDVERELRDVLERVIECFPA